LYRPDDHTSSFSTVPLGEVITEQPMQSYGSQVSSGPPIPYRTPVMPGISPQVGFPLPGFEGLDRIPGFKIQNPGESSCTFESNY